MATITTKKKEVPDKLRAIVELGFDFDDRRMSGRDAFADCPFCGKRNHCYANTDTGQWECKVCGKKGNVYSFLKQWYAMWHEEQEETPDAWTALANDRQLDPEVLKAAGIVFDGDRYAIPVYNATGAIINLRTYKIGNKLRGLPTLDAGLYGLEHYSQKGRLQERIFICEGEWDTIALRDLLDREAEEGIVLGTPGTMFKDAWLDFIDAREVIICYDHDSAGEKGVERLYHKLKTRAESISAIQWPTDLLEGTDVRDLVTKDCSFSELMDLVKPYTCLDERDKENSENTRKVPISSNLRPKWETVLEVYRKHLHMTEDLEDALKIICAVILTAKIPGPPLWVHLVGPPGSGKTLLIMSTSKCSSCIMRSTLTPHTLISGFIKGGGEDPSLLPKLNDKVLGIKDFTTILSMPRVHKDELLGTLRDAYDGEATKQYGNGVIRDYKSHFNMITGVTQQIYGERTASLGERLLMFHIIRGVGFDSTDQIRATIRNLGKEVAISSELTDIAKSFLEVTVNEQEMPEVDEWYEDRIIALAQLVAMLRASVERDPRGERKLMYRPQHEVGTRLAAQFTKTLIGLALINTPAKIGDEEYRILVRIAIDTCVGFNLEAIASLIEKPGQTMEELSEDCNLAKNTLRDQIDDLKELGAIRIEVDKSVASSQDGRGRRPNRYYVTVRLAELWQLAGLTRENGMVKSLTRERKQLKVRMLRRKRR